MPPSADSEAMGNEEPADHGEEFVRFFPGTLNVLYQP
jgi:hypothetical protein